MSRFENKLCPVCSTSFKENDDIVVCPECGTPHHRECYKKLGECALKVYHEKGFVWQGKLPSEIEREEQESPPKTSFEEAVSKQISNPDPHKAEYPSGVPQGNPYEIYRRNAEQGQHTAENNDNSNPSSHEELEALRQLPDPYQTAYRSIRSITEDEERGEDGVCGKELCYFAGRSIIHYSQAFNAFRNGVLKNGKLTKVKIFFNFSAGFFSPIHQFYRRMDLLAIVVLLLKTLLAVPGMLAIYASESIIQLSASAAGIVNALYVAGDFIGLAITVLLCIFGDYIYYRFCVRKIKKIREKFDDGKADGYYTALTERGTPSKLRIVIGILAALLVAEFTARIIPMLF